MASDGAGASQRKSPRGRRFAVLTSALQVNIHQEHWLGSQDAAKRLDVGLLTVVGTDLVRAAAGGADSDRPAPFAARFPEVAPVDGYLVWTALLQGQCGQEAVRRWARTLGGHPVVSAEDPLPGAIGVAMDERGASRQMAEHLITVHGRRRIAYLRGPATHRGAALRYQGYLDALRAHGIPRDQQLVGALLPGWDPGQAAVRLQVRSLLTAPGPAVDAVMAANDNLALAVVSAARAMGLRVPQDVAVTGFDDYVDPAFFGLGDAADPTTLSAARANVLLTTARLPFRAMEARGVELLAELADGREVPAETVLDCEVLHRRSCGCPPPAISLADDDATVAAVLRSAAGSRGDDLGDRWAEEVVIGLRRADQDDGRFLEASLRRLVDLCGRLGEAPVPWMELLSLLRTAAVRVPGALRALGEAEQRWLGIQQVTERQGHVLQDVGNRLVTAGSVEELVRVLTEQLPRLGLSTLYLVTYRPGPEGPGAVAEEAAPPGASLLLAYERGRGTLLTEADRAFDAAGLLPPARWESVGTAPLVLLPLQFNGHHLGHLLLTPGPRSGWLYQSLARHLSTGLETALLLERSRRHRQELAERVEERTAELARANAELAEANEELRTQVQERERVEEVLAHEVMHDPLTGLPNRRMLQEMLEAAVARLARHGAPVAVMFCDLDDFKWINDHLGHAAGDELLRQLAQRLRHALRPEDLVARFAGDEFVIVCTDVGTAHDVAAVARRILAECTGRYLVDDSELFVKLSVGITVATGPPATAEEMLREADSALYLAKRQGKGSVAVFDAALQREITRRVGVESGLHQALHDGTLELHYQPKVDLRTGVIAAVEALLRWRHPTRGLLHPGDFLDVAEESNLIVDIGEWVLRRACLDATTWPAQGGVAPVVQVNLAARQLADPLLLERVRRAVGDSGLDPRRLGVEITENQVLGDLRRTRDVLGRLHALGVSLALDDFGTGWSSLQWLQQLPVDEVKLDRSFVRDIDSAGQDREIVHSVIDLAHALGHAVVAEGVERTEQRQRLVTAGCDYGQGYHLGRPMALADFRRVLDLSAREHAAHGMA
ncbi:diguanylate cyclase (GGDEF)-like protein [Kineococcus xinjiangensis]|uniref:Diguanylate cyclase (GGDEF)-like protein n=1 Tax=Kineococcus xinjiangensis TaxID=512762 RepID=A0A2S6IWN2_9ACTN|nr:EAL domain-containing protein [Kineococcus xinjiangensis]PPK98695.1 diguanylate cyclase (GGDEF)-like protein [Kineococcus xinjiangensis]